VDSRPAEGDAARLVVAVSPAEADVVEAAEVAEGDRPGLVDPVVTDPEVGLGGGADGVGLEAGGEGDQWGLAVERPVGPVVVVEGAEGVELELELGDRLGRFQRHEITRFRIQNRVLSEQRLGKA
jgi:hypothetical protein